MVAGRHKKPIFHLCNSLWTGLALWSKVSFRRISLAFQQHKYLVCLHWMVCLQNIKSFPYLEETAFKLPHKECWHKECITCPAFPSVPQWMFCAAYSHATQITSYFLMRSKIKTRDFSENVTLGLLWEKESLGLIYFACLCMKRYPSMGTLLGNVQ